MHREISRSEKPFSSEAPLSLYLLTFILALLLFADFWPWFVDYSGWGFLPSWPRTLGGYEWARWVVLAAILGGARTLYSSLSSLLDGKLGADLALAIACIAAILIRKPDIAAEVVFIGLLGEVLESVTFQRTQQAIRGLVEITPRRCWLLRDGQEVRIKTEELKVGDQVVVKPGARIPADGIVLSGMSAVDVSALTGESLPVEKGPHDEVLAGSLNQQGALVIEARRVAEQTVAGRVVQLTVAALQQKGHEERTADRLARFFLPAVLALAALTFLVGLAIHGGLFGPTRAAAEKGVWEAATVPALSVLVVACPCALILATPAAVIAAMGRLAGTGVLFKGGAVLERLAQIDTIAFDKTGTLTEGRLEIGDILPCAGVTETELLHAAATAEQQSEHLLAQVMLAEARRRNLALDALEAFLAHPGAGVTARTASTSYLVGTRRLIEQEGIAVGSEVDDLLQRLDASGQTTLLVVRERTVLGVIGARDRIRPEAADVLTQLRNLGITDLAILTGDRSAVAQGVAEQLQIGEVNADLLPDQKADWVAARTATGRRVAMVGDGINDAPALARASVGLALGSTGTDVAAAAGDVVLMGDPLRPLPLLFRLSRETVRIIRQNIFWFAFGVNAVGIVVTAWLWPLFAPREWFDSSPLVAVLYHQVGSVLVLLNAMRLLWFERADTSPRWRALSQSVDRFNAWSEHYLDVNEWLHTLTHVWRQVLAVALVLLVLVYAASGLAQIEPDEVAVVQRFGHVLPEDLEPGLHYRWPWPIETVTRIQPERLRIVEIGYRSTRAPEIEAVRASGGWSSLHGDGIRRYPDESLMMTGDGELLELQVVFTYTISNIRVYLFSVNAVEDIVRSLAESVLREVVASQSFATGSLNREAFQSRVVERFRQRCGEFGPEGLGIDLRGVYLQELHPPPEVVPSYHELPKAEEEVARLLNDTLSASFEKLQEAKTQALRDRLKTQSESERLEQMALAAQQVFGYREAVRNRLGFWQEFTLFAAAWKALLAKQPQLQVVESYNHRRQILLGQRQQLLTDLLRYEVLQKSLVGREKVLINATSWQTWVIYLFDQARGLAPLFNAPDKTPRRPLEP